MPLFRPLWPLLVTFAAVPAGLWAQTVYSTVDAGTAVVGTSAVRQLSFTFTGLSVQPAFALQFGTDFQLGPASCNAGFTSCTVNATFQPRYPGLRRDAVVVRDAGGNWIASLPMTGTGRGPLAILAPGASSSLNLQSYGSFLITSFALDPAGTLYFTNGYNNTIWKVDSRTGLVVLVAGQASTAGGFSGDGLSAINALFNGPAALAFNGRGDLFVADQQNHRVRRIDAVSGIVTTVAGTGVAGLAGDGGAATQAQLNAPGGLAFDTAGNLYVADTGNQIVRQVDAGTNMIHTVAGTGTAGFTGDGGAATSARLQNPTAVVVDAAGNLYLADAGNNRVRVVTNGIIVTFAGTGTYGSSGDGGPATLANLNPLSLAIDAAGDLYVGEGTDVRRIAVAVPHTISTVAQSSYVGAIGLDAHGSVYVPTNGSALVVSPEPAALTFPNVTYGQSSAAQSFTLANAGTDPLNTASSLSLAGANPGDFQVNHNCGATLAPGASCTVSIQFSPAAVGNRSATLRIADNSAASPHQAQLSGVGLAGPQATLSSLGVSFGQQAPGALATQIVTLSNPGSGPLTVNSISLADPTGSFSQTTTCGTAIAAGGQCQITVSFTAQSANVASASLVIATAGQNSPQTIALSGQGQPTGLIATSAATLAFTTQRLNTASPIRSVTITNSGAGFLTSPAIVLGGANPQDFRIMQNTCGSAIAPGAACQVQVAFQPTRVGGRSATLTVSQVGGATSQPVALSGAGAGQPLMDFDGDGKTDFCVFRPATQVWYIIPSSTPSSFTATQWGVAGDVPVPGDYDGDGRTDLAVYRPATGTWHIIPSSQPAARTATQWGLAGDIPVPGDYDGDGHTDLAVYRPSTGTWYIIPSTNPGVIVTKQWGMPGDLPIPADYDGDGRTDYAVWRSSNGGWYIVPSSAPSTIQTFQWGLSGDRPVPGDYDGDGRADLAVWRPGNATWYVAPSGLAGASLALAFGSPNGTPIVGDFDGDGRADFAVWDPETGNWQGQFISKLLASFVQQWGLTGDQPL